jgi:hypothetical protein
MMTVPTPAGTVGEETDDGSTSGDSPEAAVFSSVGTLSGLDTVMLG